MTSLTTSSGPSATPTTRSTAAPAHAPADEPTLITEQQVLLGTALARSGPAPEPAKKQKAARRQYPKRYGWLESSLMGREMDRL